MARLRDLHIATACRGPLAKGWKLPGHSPDTELSLIDTFSTSADRLIQSGQVRSLAAQKWALFRTLKNPQAATFRSVFVSWLLITKRHKVHRAQQMATTQAKQTRIDQILTEARQAADRHDLSRLHQLVKKLHQDSDS